MITMTMSKETSRCIAFIELANACVDDRISVETLVHMTTHMFDHDLDLELQGNMVNALFIDLREYTCMIEQTKTQMFMSQAMQRSINDQHLSKMTDMCNAVFAVNADGEGTTPRQVALWDDLGNVTEHLPVFVHGDLHIWTIPAGEYTREEAQILIDDVLSAYDEAKTKIQHMRDGEDY